MAYSCQSINLCEFELKPFNAQDSENRRLQQSWRALQTKDFVTERMKPMWHKIRLEKQLIMICLQLYFQDDYLRYSLYSQVSSLRVWSSV